MNDIMLDIETLGTGPNAVIIQIAALDFNRETGEIGDHVDLALSLKESMDKGFSVDASTLSWWLETDSKLLSRIVSSGGGIQDRLFKLRNFLNKPEVKIWSHATFDFPLVQNYLKTFGVEPVDFRAARDIRTLVDLSGINLDDYDWNAKTHDALDDCKFQVRYCVDAIGKLKGAQQ